MPVGSSDSTPRPPVSSWVVVLALVGALAAAVLLAGPLTVAIDAVFHRNANFAKVFRYLALGLMAVAIAVTLRPWRDLPGDWWGLRPRRGRPHGSPLRPVASPDAPGVRRNLALVAAGFGVIVALIAAVAAIHFAVGQVEWDRTDDALPKFLRRLWKFLLPAIPFALLEETFFRGWLLDRCRTHLRSAFAATAIASVVFGFVHAFHKIYAPNVEPGPAGAL